MDQKFTPNKHITGGSLGSKLGSCTINVPVLLPFSMKYVNDHSLLYALINCTPTPDVFEFEFEFLFRLGTATSPEGYYEGAQ